MDLSFSSCARRAVPGEHAVVCRYILESSKPYSYRFAFCLRYSHAACVELSQLHMDTWLPCLKIFLFDRPTYRGDGAFEYVPGSHRPTVSKLKLLHDFSLKGLALNAPRVYGYDAARFMMSPITPIEVPAYTLMLVDTSGFHRRGTAAPGTIRTQYRPIWPFGGVDRLHPFRTRSCDVSRNTGKAACKQTW